MRFANEAAATAFRVLGMWSAEIESAGPWRWRCVVQNGARTPITAAMREGFLQLAGPASDLREGTRAPEEVLLANDTLAGGARFALDRFGSGLHVRSDVVLLEERLLMDRVRSALAGLGQGTHRLEHSAVHENASVSSSADTGEVDFEELLRETAWRCTARGPDEFAVELDAASAPPARIKRDESGIAIGVELIRPGTMSELSQRALAIFLLTAGSALRLARGRTAEVDGQRSFGFQVSLAASAVVEEIDHALAALSIAHKMFAREANVLLDEAAARCYLAARDIPTEHNHEHHKEN
jgi:hypothetical protein